MSRNSVKVQYIAMMYGKRTDRRRAKRLERIVSQNMSKHGTPWGPR